MLGKDLTNQEKLEEVYHMVKENNDILRGLRRRSNISAMFTIFYWTVILGSLVGVYYFVNPLVSGALEKKDSIEKSLQNLDQLKNILPEISTIQNAMGGLQGQKASGITAK